MADERSKTRDETIQLKDRMTDLESKCVRLKSPHTNQNSHLFTIVLFQNPYDFLLSNTNGNAEHYVHTGLCRKIKMNDPRAVKHKKEHHKKSIHKSVYI